MDYNNQMMNWIQQNQYFDLKQFEIEYFEGDLYILDEKGWTNITQMFKNKDEQRYYIKGMIKNTYVKQMQKFPEKGMISGFFNSLMEDAHYKKYNGMSNIDNNKIVFLNGYFDKEMVWHDLKTPFTPYQIKLKYNENAQGTELVKRFFNELTCNDELLKQTLFEVIGTAISSRNMSIMPIFISSHSTSGKGTLVDMITKITSIERLGKINHEAWLGKKQSAFSLAPIRNKTWVFMDELPISLDKNATEKIKDYVDSKEFISFERKGIDAEVMLNTPTFFAATNNNVNIYNVDDAIKRRIIWIPFNMNKTGKAKFTGKEIKELLNSKEALEWVVKKSMQAFTKVINRPGVRNEKYTIPQFSIDYWNTSEDSSVAKAIMESTSILSSLFLKRAEFISNADIKEGLKKLKEEDEFSKLTLPAVKKELSNYFSAKRLGNVKDGRGKDGKERGIRIEWFEDEVKLITLNDGTIVTEESYMQDLEEKYKIFLETESELGEQNIFIGGLDANEDK